MSLAIAAEVTRSGLKAYSNEAYARATNLANAQTTKTADGGPFRPLLTSMQSEATRNGGRGVAILTEQSTAPAFGEHDPLHPHADDKGMVYYPDIDMNREITALAIARRAYQANIAASDALRAMGRAATEMLR